jgi:hypothetical protein
MSQWIETELAESQLQDTRHRKRLTQLLGWSSEHQLQGCREPDVDHDGSVPRTSR